MKIGDDGDEIDLDLTLEKYQQAKDFLSRILKTFFDAANLRVDDILTDGALDRLVLASGGSCSGFSRDLSALHRNRAKSRLGSERH
jgi:hypothetical protein